MTRGAQSAFAAAVLDAALPPPDGLTTHNGSSVAQRFGVYRNNVMVSLVEALSAGFPVVESLVGPEFFQAMARAFITQHPPGSRIMTDFGAAFPAFIADFPPAADLPYLAAIARLERARTTSYHAADADPVADADFAALPPDAIGDMRCVLLPATQIVAAECAIFSIWAAHQGALDLGDVDPTLPEAVLITRPHHDVEVSRLGPGAARFFTGVQDGETLAEAAFNALASTADFNPAAAIQLLVASRCAAHLVPSLQGSDTHG